MKTLIRLALFGMMLMTGTNSHLFGQDQGGGGGNRRDMSPEQFREEMEKRVKASLKATDDEWNIIQPRLDKVVTAQREAFSGRMGGFGRTRDNNNASSAATPSGTPGTSEKSSRDSTRTPSPEAEALKAALESEETPAKEIKTKLNSLRDSRSKKQDDLKVAREELRKVLSLRQEATLVMQGILD